MTLGEVYRKKSFSCQIIKHLFLVNLKKLFFFISGLNREATSPNVKMSGKFFIHAKLFRYSHMSSKNKSGVAATFAINGV